MNNEELHALATDFRRLRSEIMDRSNQILSLFEAALKRSAALQTPNEQFNYLDYGIRITEGDYVLTADRSQPASEAALFSESEKRQTARSVEVSHATDLNEGGATANLLRSNSNKVKFFARNALTLPRATGGAHKPEHVNTQQPEAIDSIVTSGQAKQGLQVSDTPKHLIGNLLGGLKPQLSVVTEGNSPLNSCSSNIQSIASISHDHLAEPHSADKLTQESFPESNDATVDLPKGRNFHLAGHESAKDSIVSNTFIPDIKTSNSVAIEFNDLIVQRFIDSNFSSLDANTSQDSVADSVVVASSLPAKERLRGYPENRASIFTRYFRYTIKTPIA
ncbi:hypothetical protein HDU81_008532 [Chytriomyces hyalinus]|nr:hypothetical protein HDU81_008532 [Chytriomyces hyalinus]